MREIPLSQNKVALVSDVDYDRVMAAGPWSADRSRHTWYARRTITLERGRGGRKTSQRLHNFVLNALWIDHRDGDGLNNQRSNLRPATRTQNGSNQPKRRHSISRFKGVTRRKHGSKHGGSWIAQISDRAITKYIGSFSTEEEAARAYDAAARELFGEFAYLNFKEQA